MEVRLLGPLEIADGGRPIPCRGPRQGALLVLLVLHANQVVPSERLLVELWGADAPPTAANALQAAVSRLRGTLPPGRLVTRAPGYLLRVAVDELDTSQFERLLAGGREALERGAVAEAARSLRLALSLWRGPALADFRYEPFAQAEIARLEELRLACLEERVEADLALGAGSQLVGELRQLVISQPLRERPRGQLMLALYRGGRQSEALEVYGDLRELLVEELGLEPAPALRELQAAILRQDPALGAVPGPPEAPAPVRKPVTVLCAELRVAPVAGVDPEALDVVQARALPALTSALERHGGKLAATAGDRFLGVFGVAALHEDDALRAAQAALEAREALATEADALEREGAPRLAVRFGLAAGEALVGGPGPTGFAGDAVARAVALAEEATPGQILVGDEVRQLADAAVRVEPAGPGRLRLLGVRAGARPLPVRLDAPLVGRDDELDRLAEAFARAARERAPALVTLLGEAGIGKTRLVRELAASLAGEAEVLTGRCLPYGEGVTFWPLRELATHAGASRRTRAELAGLLGDEQDAARVADLLASAIDPPREGAFEAVEIFWATRRLLETLARRRPLLVVLEDLHWAEPTFIDLVESLAAQAGDAPLLLLAVARPELLQQRPSWAAGAARAATFELEPLADGDAATLLDALAEAEAPPRGPTRRRLLEAAGGNPLFLEQLAASLGERSWSGDGAPIPPTIQGLLAARLERLGPGEQVVVEGAAVLGRDFRLEAIAELLPAKARAPLRRNLDALVAKGLVQPRPAGPGGAEVFRFRHVLVQQAAYRAIPKSRRAELHQLVAGLRSGPGAQDEIVGYHLERAYRYRAELGRVGEPERVLAAEAAERLGRAARAALVRGDLPGGASLLERAVSLLPDGSRTRAALLPGLGVALVEAGRLADADRVLVEAIGHAEAGGDHRLAARALVEHHLVRLHAGPGGELEDARAVADAALQVLKTHGDDLDQCRAWRLQAWVAWTRSLAASADQAWRRAAEHARRAGDQRELFEILGWRASAAAFGPTPVPEAIRVCHGIRRQVRSNPVAASVTLRPLGLLHAMRGELDEARRLVGESNRLLDELGRMHSAVSHHEAMVEMLAGRPAAAEERLRRGHAALEEMGERALRSTTAAMLAQTVYAQRRYPEAEELCRVSQRDAAPDDLVTQVMWRGVAAKVLARGGDDAQAEALAREALALVERTDLLTHHGDALLDLAEVLRLVGRPREADAATRAAVERYEAKGNLVSAGRARARLGAMTPA